MPDRPRRRIAGQRRRPTDVTPATTPITPSDEALEEVAETLETLTPTTPEGPETTASPEAPASDAPDTDAPTREAASAGAQDGEAASASASSSSGEAVERASRTTVLLTVTLAVLVVLVLALAGIAGVKAWKGQQAEEARGEAAAAGRKAAETALSYDYRTLDKSFADARATMTPEFAGKFDETAKVAGELATKTKATVRAEVREVGVRDGDADRVTLVIFVNQTTTSTITQGKPRVDLNRTRFTMVRNGSRWLVQEIAGL